MCLHKLYSCAKALDKKENVQSFGGIYDGLKIDGFGRYTNVAFQAFLALDTICIAFCPLIPSYGAWTQYIAETQFGLIMFLWTIIFRPYTSWISFTISVLSTAAYTGATIILPFADNPNLPEDKVELYGDIVMWTFFSLICAHSILQFVEIIYKMTISARQNCYRRVHARIIPQDSKYLSEIVTPGSQKTATP